MRSWSLAAVAALAMAVPAEAAVITLENVDPLGDDFLFSYQGTLGPDEGILNGSKLVIFDFLGLVDGSIFTGSANLQGSSELLTATPFITSGYTDDPTIPNLVFTYVGPGFQNSGGPFAPFDFHGFGAASRYGQVAFSSFTAFTVKNNPPASENSQLVQVGVAGVPALPEPATWATMLIGFGMAGSAIRRRRARYAAC